MNLLTDEDSQRTHEILITTVAAIGSNLFEHRSHLYRILTEDKSYLRKLVGKIKHLQIGELQTFSVARAYACEHYINGMQMQCLECDKVYKCSKCHNEAEDHSFNLKCVICVFCGAQQAMSCMCIACAQSFGCQICEKCCFVSAIEPLFEPLFHCDKCGKCLIGKDLVHCDACGRCYTRQKIAIHECGIVYEGDCPICLAPLGKYNARKLHCGHQVHVTCFASTEKPTCPLCLKIGFTAEKRRRYLKHQAEKRQYFAIDVTNCIAHCIECETQFATQFSANLGIFCTRCGTFNVEVIGEYHGEQPVEKWVLKNGDDVPFLRAFILENVPPEVAQQLLSNDLSVHDHRREVIEWLNNWIKASLSQ